MEHEIWLTRLFNDYLAGLANTILGLFNIQAHNPARPWENWITCEIFVVVLMMILVAFVRNGLSVDKPGKMQHLFEAIWGFLHDNAVDAGIHHPAKYMPFFGTLFLFVLFCNLIGIIPAFESPTMFPWVPCGIALAAFFYYNIWGLREQGVFTYAKHFAGPIPALAPIMVPIEIVSHLARPMSLTIRLFANMFAGEQVTLAFLKLTFLIAPAVFMGLHVFVSFLQAYIFALLTMIYVSGAVAHEEH